MRRDFLILGFFISVFLLSLTVPTSSLFAEKVGYVDLFSAMNTCDRGIDMKEEITRRAQELREKIMKKMREIEEFRKDVERKSAMLSKEALSEKQKEFEKKMEELDKLKAESDQELSLKKQLFEKEMMDEVKEVVAYVAKKKGVSLVFDKNALVYAPNALDLTDDVIKELNRRYKKRRGGKK